MHTMASWFDGIAGFPLAGSRNGIRAVWASEIEPFPVKVTKLRFPGMKHYGDITKIDGSMAEPVDVVTFGSPCQDLSVAGKRAGLKHGDLGHEETTRSGLFMEAVRIIKEMRDATSGACPRFAVWENVPGAFSSNNGEDFRAVLEELARVEESDASIPRPAKWAGAGCIMGNNWSLAWRTFDAQHWGVPQRRRRIYLVCDFAGGRAPEILFEREGLRRYSAAGGEAREGLAADAQGGAGDAVGLTNRGYPCRGPVETLRAGCHGALPMVCGGTGGRLGDAGVALYENHGQASAEVFHRVRSDEYADVEVMGTMTARQSKDADGLVIAHEAPTLFAKDGVASTLLACMADKMGLEDQHVNQGCPNFVHHGMSIRRLTPLECERLQGFPDGWTDIEGASDSGRYKALGNSLAIPPTEYVMEGIAVALGREHEAWMATA